MTEACSLIEDNALKTKSRSAAPLTQNFVILHKTWSVCGQWRNNGVGRVGKVQGAPECKGPRVPTKKIITVKCMHNYSHHRMFRCSIAPANTDKNLNSTLMSCGIHCVDDKNDNEEGRAPLNICLGAPESLVTPLSVAYFLLNKC